MPPSVATVAAVLIGDLEEGASAEHIGDLGEGASAEHIAPDHREVIAHAGPARTTQMHKKHHKATTKDSRERGRQARARKRFPSPDQSLSFRSTCISWGGPKLRDCTGDAGQAGGHWNEAGRHR